MGATRTTNGTPTTAVVRARGLLIIEDDAPIRRALRNALSSVADRLLEAPTGREGIDLAATARPDLIVLDLGLRTSRGSTCAGSSGAATEGGGGVRHGS